VTEDEAAMLAEIERAWGEIERLRTPAPVNHPKILDGLTPLTADAIDAWADRFSAAMSGAQEPDVTARLVGEARRWLDRCVDDPLAVIDLAEAHVSRGRMLDMRPAPLTEAEARAWALAVADATYDAMSGRCREDNVRCAATPIKVALLASNRGNIPDAVRAEKGGGVQ
jgi:truncated hemoglobin YjbI